MPPPLTSRVFHPSSNFVISCGTVPIDLPHKKLLLLRFRPTDELLFPKGRKNINEDLKAAALRETFEETGYTAKILPTRVTTNATSARQSDDIAQSNHQNEDVRRGEDKEHEEPIALTQRIMENGMLKLTFWWASSVDMTDVPARGTQEESEDFEVVWMDIEKGIAALSFEDDRSVARMAVHAIFG